MIPAESAKPKREPTQRERRRQALFDEVIELASRLRDDGPELLRRAAIPRSDGYPTTSGLEPSRGGGTTDRVGHRVVAALEAEANRQVEEAKAKADNRPYTPHDPDPVATNAKAMHTFLLEARKLLRQADRARARAVYIPVAQRPPETPEVPGCINCARFEVFTVAQKAGRCWACYGYRARHEGRDAPGELVLGRPENAGRRRYVAAGG